MKSQLESIKTHLEKGKSINPIQALNKFGCFRLGARIYDLKTIHHMDIKTIPTTVKGKTFATYKLAA